MHALRADNTYCSLFYIPSLREGDFLWYMRCWCRCDCKFQRKPGASSSSTLHSTPLRQGPSLNLMFTLYTRLAGRSCWAGAGIWIQVLRLVQQELVPTELSPQSHTLLKKKKKAQRQSMIQYFSSHLILYQLTHKHSPHQQWQPITSKCGQRTEDSLLPHPHPYSLTRNCVSVLLQDQELVPWKVKMSSGQFAVHERSQNHEEPTWNLASVAVLWRNQVLEWSSALRELMILAHGCPSGTST